MFIFMCGNEQGTLSSELMRERRAAMLERHSWSSLLTLGAETKLLKKQQGRFSGPSVLERRCIQYLGSGALGPDGRFEPISFIAIYGPSTNASTSGHHRVALLPRTFSVLMCE